MDRREGREGEEGEGMGFLLAISSYFPVNPVHPVILSDSFNIGGERVGA
jgi:hypothetical protein